MTRPELQTLRISRSWEQEVTGPPEKVFPLLCPVREYDWLRGWKSDLVFLASGHAEDGGVFVTEFPDRGRGTWVITCYEPPRAIGFVVFYPELYVERLDVSLTAAAGGATRLRWSRTYTGLSEEGNRFLEKSTGAALDERMHKQMGMLEYYCATGTMLAP